MLASNWYPIFQFPTELCTKERFIPASQNLFGTRKMDLSVWSIVLEATILNV